MARILFVQPGYVPPPDDERESPFYHLSDRHEGDVVNPVWGKRHSSSFRRTAGRFQYHFTFSQRLAGLVRPMWELAFAVTTGLRLHYLEQRRYEIVMAYSWNTSGVAALILKWLSGAKFILGIPGMPQQAYRYSAERISCRLRLKSRLSAWLLRRLLKRCDGVKLLYPDQLDGYLPKRPVAVSVCHNLVPVSLMEPVDVDEKYILLVGQPWYLKGVDVLIKAFKQISQEFPQYRLRVVGGCRDRSYFEQLREGDVRIEFVPGVPREEAWRQIAHCSVFVLASRTEGMGRVLLEAMALRKPIIASRVGGIPHYIHDGENGLLFDSENVEQLAGALRRVLGDPGLARRLAERGCELVHERYSEKRFAENFDALVDAVLSGQQRAGRAAEALDCAGQVAPGE